MARRAAFAVLAVAAVALPTQAVYTAENLWINSNTCASSPDLVAYASTACAAQNCTEGASITCPTTLAGVQPSSGRYLWLAAFSGTTCAGDSTAGFLYKTNTCAGESGFYYKATCTPGGAYSYTLCTDSACSQNCQTASGNANDCDSGIQILCSAAASVTPFLYAAAAFAAAAAATML